MDIRGRLACLSDVALLMEKNIDLHGGGFQCAGHGCLLMDRIYGFQVKSLLSEKRDGVTLLKNT